METNLNEKQIKGLDKLPSLTLVEKFLVLELRCSKICLC